MKRPRSLENLDADDSELNRFVEQERKNQKQRRLTNACRKEVSTRENEFTCFWNDLFLPQFKEEIPDERAPHIWDWRCHTETLSKWKELTERIPGNPQGHEPYDSPSPPPPPNPPAPRPPPAKRRKISENNIAYNQSPSNEILKPNEKKKKHGKRKHVTPKGTKRKPYEGRDPPPPPPIPGPPPGAPPFHPGHPGVHPPFPPFRNGPYHPFPPFPPGVPPHLGARPFRSGPFQGPLEPGEGGMRRPMNGFPAPYPIPPKPPYSMARAF